MSLPPPRPGLVISYAYLWAREHRKGLEEGRKDRPCAIVAARQVIEGREVVTVVPITHARPDDPADTVEISATLKAHLGLDDAPSWIVVTETRPTISCGRGRTFGQDQLTGCCRLGSSPMSAIGSCRSIGDGASTACNAPSRAGTGTAF